MSEEKRVAHFEKCGAGERKRCCVYLSFGGVTVVKCNYPNRNHSESRGEEAYDPYILNLDYPDCKRRRKALTD